MSSPKIAVLCYHKNANEIYPEKWIERYRKTVLGQTHKDFDIFEIEYGGGDFRIFEDSEYESKEFPTFCHGMVYAINTILELGYDYIFNTNVDDYYSKERIEVQLRYLENGYDLVSSNFALIDEGEVVEIHQFHKLNIRRELTRDHNIIGHPVCAYSRDFFNHHHYKPEEIPKEDLMLWKRTISQRKFIIAPQILLFHRLHKNSVCQSENR